MKRLGLFAASMLFATAAVMAQPMGMPQLISHNANDDVPTDIIYEAPEGEMKYYNTSQKDGCSGDRKWDCSI